MRTLYHVVVILLFGVAVGLTLRGSRNQPTTSHPAVPPDVVMHTNDQPLDPESVTDDQPQMAPEGWLSKFELTERSGQTVSSSDLLGKPYVVSFFYSTCPSICVQQNQMVRQLQAEFEAGGVRFVSISVDPETDTPAAMQEYAARFGADADQWLFMTGDLTYIRRVGAEVFRLPVNRKFHTEKFVLVDSAGQIIGYYNWPEPRQFEKLKEDIRQLIAQA